MKAKEKWTMFNIVKHKRPRSKHEDVPWTNENITFYHHNPPGKKSLSIPWVWKISFIVSHYLKTKSVILKNIGQKSLIYSKQSTKSGLN